MRSNWKKIKRGDVASAYAGIHVTLNTRGQINMSRVTHQRMDEPAAVELFFDEANNRIGLKPCAKSAADAYPVNRGSRCGGRRIFIRRLINEYAIDLPATVRFYDAQIDQDGILVLDLRSARVPPSVLAHQRRADRKPKLPAKRGDAAEP